MQRMETIHMALDAIEFVKRKISSLNQRYELSYDEREQELTRLRRRLSELQRIAINLMTEELREAA